MVHPIPTSSFIQLNDFCTCNIIVCHVFIVTVVDKYLYACISAQEALGVQAFTPTAHKNLIFMIVPGNYCNRQECWVLLSSILCSKLALLESYLFT